MIALIDFMRFATKQFVVTFLALWAFVMAVEYTFNRLQPASFWVTYISTQPSSEVLHNTALIEMQSVGIVKRSIDLEHHDILRCKTEGSDAWRFVSQQVVRVRYTSPTYIGFEDLPDGASKYAETSGGAWDYRSSKPMPPAKCKIEANITFKPSLGIVKKLQLESPVFFIT